MEEISSRRSSNDEFFGSSLMEPTIHDVMSLELSHHSLGDSYLDPRSFGDGGSFDEFGGQMESRYDNMSHGYDQPVQQRSHNYSSHHQPLPRTLHVSRGLAADSSSGQTRALSAPGSRFDHHATHSPMRSGVPTYPVKTVDPSTCSQYAPARMPVKPPRIRHSTGRPKKEPMDPKTVEDEVARNVSQILSATKQQKLAQEAQQRCGIIAPVSRINFSCSDCGKAMTSHRNLQRHRQTSCCRKVGEWVDKSHSWPNQWEKERLSEDGDSLPGIGGNSLSRSTLSEDSGWCSPNQSYSPSGMGSIDMGNMLPLSLDTDDSQTHSSSASHCSNSSNGKGPQETFMCDACKKTVCSLRSLKRHHTTCKQYMAEFGLPPDIDSSSVVPIKPRSARRVKTPTYKEDNTSGSVSPELGDDLYFPSSERRPPPPKRAPADSTQNDDDRPAKQLALAINTCADCNRQLCSASNLKRHRATCKAALTKGEFSQPTATPAPSYSSNLPELPARDRNIIDRSYAAAVAASEQVRQQARAAQNCTTGDGSKPYTAFIVTSPRTPNKQQPWVTVGEHLRAKHVQQKMMEIKEEPQGAVLIQNPAPAGAVNHNQVVEIRRSSLIEKDVTSKEEKSLSHRPEPTPQKTNLIENKSEAKETRPTHVTVVKADPAEIPPLESIITTQPLSGDRVTGVPVLVHDTRQYSAGKQGQSSQPGEFQCPECKKTYSCRKNVKRHRMAVHKLSPDDITRYPGPAPCPHAVIGESCQLSPSLPRILMAARGEGKSEYKPEPLTLSPTLLDKGFSQDATWQSMDYLEEDERDDTGRIAAELKMNTDIDLSDEKKTHTELAEADTTFNEDREFGNSSHHSSPGAVTSTGPLPSLASWMSSRPLSVEIPYGGARSAGHSPLFKSRRLDCDFTPSFLCQDDGLPLDPMLGHGVSSDTRSLEDDLWYKPDEIPDSTTNQRLDRSTSPCILLDGPQLGALPYTRKRALSGGNSANSPTFVNDPKQARHLCQDCGKFYSSEWNLERHRRESCPTKIAQGTISPSVQPEEVSILMGSCRFLLPRAALTKASSAFCSLFQIHDPSRGDLRLDGDPMDFQNLLDVYNDPINLTRSNVDTVLSMAHQYKFTQVTDFCTKFIAEELSKMSLMHAIRLADHYKLLSVKQRLFSSISIEVFRALNSDRDYQMMSSELKAELLEKWGTFL